MSVGAPKRVISDLEKAAKLKLELATAAVDFALDTHFAVLAKVEPVRKDANEIMADDMVHEAAKATARAQLKVAQDLAQTSMMKKMTLAQLSRNAEAELEVVLAQSNPEFRAALLADRVAEVEYDAANNEAGRVDKAEYKAMKRRLRR